MNLGEILVGKGVIGEAELEEALRSQQEHQERIGASLVRLGLITEEQALEEAGRCLRCDLEELEG